MQSHKHRSLLAALAFLVPVSLSLVAPLRPQGGDTVPGKIGMHVLQCERSFDLAGASWLREQVLGGRRPYYAVVTADQRRLVSTWGPAPAFFGALTSVPLPTGSRVDDAVLARRARQSATLAVGLSALFLFLAIAEHRSPWVAFVGSLAASLSFAGVAVLGQGLWQQTIACPLLAASWWALSRGHGSRSGWWGSAVVVLSVVAALVRPADMLLALAGLGVACWQLGRQRAVLPAVAAALLSSSVVALFGGWNLHQFGTWWPSGQLVTHGGATGLFASDLGSIGLAYSALLLSPSRGLLVFAPVVIIAVVAGARASSTAKVFTVAVIGQLVVAAIFYKWWGGVSFGPRLLALTVWASCYLLFGLVSRHDLPMRLTAAGVIVGVAVGLVGLFGYDPRKWDLRVDVDRNPAAAWSVADNVVSAALSPLPPDTPAIIDSPEGPFIYCVDRTFSPAKPEM